MKLPKKILVRVRLPLSWPWETLTFSGVGTVSKIWTEFELNQIIIAALQSKGLEVEHEIPPRQARARGEVTNGDQGNA